jgi:hypothetical protein
VVLFSTPAEANTGPIFAHSFIKGPVENRPFVGSVMIVNNTDAESIRSKLKSDIYTQEGIWDWENSDSLPFHTLERTRRSWKSGISPLGVPPPPIIIRRGKAPIVS